MRATVEALNDAGEVLVAKTTIIYYLATGGEVLHGASGSLALRLRGLSRAHDSEALSDTEYEAALRAALTACVTESIGTASGPAPNIHIQGKLEWTDSAGGTHPVRLADVEIRDDELIGSDLVTTVSTNLGGNFAVTVDNDDGPGQGGRDIFIGVLAQGPGFTVKDGTTGDVQRIDSNTESDLPDGTVPTIDLTGD